MENIVIKFENADIGYRSEKNNNVLIQNLNLSFEENYFYTILGVSGIGKTTLLKTIVGLIKVLSGKLTVNGNVSLLFQEPRLFPHMNVIENVAYPLKIAGLGKEEREIAAKSLLQRLEIEHIMYDNISKLSGGEAKRVSLARALIKKPKVLLLDEPLTNLDTNLKIKIRNLIKDIHDTYKLTTIMVTHDIFDAVMLSDKLVYFDNKKLIVCDDTEKVLMDEKAEMYFSKFKTELKSILSRFN